MSARSAIIIFALVLLLFVGTGSAAPFSGDSQQVIIVMKEQPAHGAGSAELAMFAAESQRNVVTSLKSMGVGEVRPLWSVNAIAATLTEDQVKQVAARRDVARVVPDRIVTLDLLTKPEKGEREMQFFKPGSAEVEWIDPSHPAEDDIAWGLSWIEAPDVWSNGIDGTGVTVAVVDTGIDSGHPDLAGKIIGWVDLVNDLDEPYDDAGHGTHCAGTVAGTGAGGVYTGVAPGADLIGVKVFDANGSGQTSTIIAGFETAVELGADLISYSGGSRWYDTFSEYVVCESPEGVDISFEVTNDGDGYDPSFILLMGEEAPFADLELTMMRPDGTVYSGVDCDWLSFPNPPGYVMLKFIGDEALPAGNWTLNAAYPSINASNRVWHSGKGDNLDNVLYQRFDYSDYVGVLDSATFEMETWYDIESSWDFGYLEVYNVGTSSWDVILEFTGTGDGVYTANLTEYLWQQDGQYQLSYFDLRLRYETDGSVINAGWYIDWMAIPEIGFYDDASGDTGWEADPEDGWSRTKEEYPVSIEWIVYYTDNGTSLQSQTVDQIVADGVTFVTSTGNDGEFGLRTVSGPATPAAIHVGATGSMQDYIAPYSSRGPVGWGADTIIKPDVVAPGTQVLSASTRDGELYRTMSGTSMACPHVAGVAALLLQVNPDLEPEDIRSILTSTAVDLGPEGPDNDYGYGRVSAWAAVNATEPLAPPVYDGPRLHAGFGYEYLKPGEENVITAIVWNGTPSQDEPVQFLIRAGDDEVLNTTVMTDASGMVTVSFVPTAYEYDYQVTDDHGNVVSGWIYTRNSHSQELLLIDTPWKRYEALQNSTIPVKYTFVDPVTMEPYTGDLRFIFGTWQEEFVNETLTPVNGVIEHEIDGSTISSYYGEMKVSPIADASEVLYVGEVTFFDDDWFKEEIQPVVSRAAPKSTTPVLVKRYSPLNATPAPDETRELPIIWLSEADVRSLSAEYPVEMHRLLEGEVEQMTPGYRDLLAEIENLQMDFITVPYLLKNGIGKADIPVPEGAYLGIVIAGSDFYGESGVNSEMMGSIALIIVDLWPFTHHPVAPDTIPSQAISIRGDWAGGFSSDQKSIVPGTEMNVTCQLWNPETGEPVAGTVYLYTSDQSAVVTTGADGYGYASLPVDIRFEGEWSGNGIQVIGISGDAYAYTYVYPPYEWPVMTGEYIPGGDDGILMGDVTIIDQAGDPIPMPGIFEVSRQDVKTGWDSDHGYRQAATIHSESITGDGEFAAALPFGSYLITLDMKDYFYRGNYSQGNWWSYSMFIGATPLVVENPPPLFVEQAGLVDVTVRMTDGRAGVPVYLTYDSVGPYAYYEELPSLFSEYGGVDVTTTGADGAATLKMYIPENGYLYWEIGGGTPDHVFTTLSGYSVQSVGPEPVAPTANFVGVPATGTAPLTIRFSDTSTGTPTSWEWNFGDGTTSTDRHPVKLYGTPGQYNVTLTVTNEQGSDTITKEGYITVHVPSRVQVGDLDIATGMNRTTGISVEQIQGAIAFGVNLTFDQTLVELVEITPNASVADDLYQLIYDIDNTTGRADISMTLTRERDFIDLTGIIDIRFEAGQKVGAAPIEITGAEWSPDTFAYEIFRIQEDGDLSVHLRGDFNRNDRIDIGDVSKVAWMVAGLTTEDPEADFDNSGSVDGNDAAKIAYFYVGKINDL
ncbi:hypothetical protein RJ53_04710 [Methanocalculus chunghsingensis]|uniref:PKD domain-containing protein n=1 Tax=Methanocalculus chunghsingensis TaxID=156457 RepID=A0A8J7W5T7_9EURY|nr:S8 family serine peptidase [Methanocalculus chunghsingensis]MBR1368849.1 hypothetical protein [Methanocalculus chunghsingensis]